jgi:hypothetical protein
MNSRNTQYQLNLKMLVAADEEYSRTEGIWEHNKFDRWLQKHWGVSYSGPDLLRVVDESKYVFFVLRFSGHTD